MTNKKFKVAAMSMALTACVAAQPLIANAADDVNAVSNGAPDSAPNRKGKARLLHPLLMPLLLTTRTMKPTMPRKPLAKT